MTIEAVMVLLTREEAEVAIEALEEVVFQGRPGDSSDLVALQRVVYSLRLQLDRAEGERAQS